MMTVTTIQDYLTSMSDLISRHNGSMYKSLEQFMDEQGHRFTAPAHPLDHYENVQAGEMGMCYSNCMEYVIENPDTELLYCEGFAMGIIPMQHAWLSTANGEVIDPTWGQGYSKDYHGVAFDRQWAIRLLCDKGSYGLIDDWENKWPLLNGKHNLEWKVEVGYEQ